MLKLTRRLEYYRTHQQLQSKVIKIYVINRLNANEYAISAHLLGVGFPASKGAHNLESPSFSGILSNSNMAKTCPTYDPLEVKHEEEDPVSSSEREPDSDSELSDLSQDGMNANVGEDEMKEAELPVVKFRSEQSLNGWRLSDLKSGLQKYIRRGETVSALYCLGELLTFQLGKSPRDVKRIMTNVRHRLIVIALEDIGNLELFPTLLQLIKEFTHESMHKAVTLMCQSKKVRIGSHAKSVATICDMVVSDYKSCLSSIDETIISQLESLIPLKDELSNPQKWGSYLSAILSSTDTSKSFIGLFWAWRIKDANVYKKVSFTRKKRSEWQIFEAIRKTKYFTLEESKAFESAFDEISDMKESHLAWIVPLVYILKKFTREEPDLSYTIPEVLFVNQNTKHPFNKSFKMDDFVFDLHTNGAKYDKDAFAKFALEGAKVVPVNRARLVPEWEKVYIARKVYQDKLKHCLRSENSKKRRPSESASEHRQAPKSKRIKKKNKISSIQTHLHTVLESEAYQLQARAQLTTSNMKTDVYFAIEKKTNKHVLVKGPISDRTNPELLKSINAWKRSAELPEVTGIKQVNMVPDLFHDVPVGVRKQVDRKQHYPFIVMDSLIESKESEDIPVELKTSKLWGPTLVVNWNSPSFHKYNWKTTNFQSETPQVQQDYVLGILGRYICGVNDFADRNFVLANGRLYSVDEDTQVNNVRPITELLRGKKKREFVRQWIAENEQFVSNWLLSLEAPNSIPGCAERIGKLLAINPKMNIISET